MTNKEYLTNKEYSFKLKNFLKHVDNCNIELYVYKNGDWHKIGKTLLITNHKMDLFDVNLGGKKERKKELKEILNTYGNYNITRIIIDVYELLIDIEKVEE